ncbi:MAG TPA: protoporphyrinogen oxidase, partial [Myxococcota bacterium]|nr:protoporphyrinogen oxidase [Myxococcota bacterium]
DLVELAIDAPDAVRDAARRLRCSPLRYVNVALDVPRPLDGNHWIYLPEARYPFYRVGSASNALPGLAPAGRSSLYVELANDQQASEPEVVASLAGFLKEIGSIEHERQIRFAAFREHPWGYVIFDRHCADARAAILDFLASRGVHSIGRYGGWTYNSMEDAILDGLRTAESLARPA